MRRLELVALRSTTLSWDKLAALLPKTLETIGLVADRAAADGRITARDHGGEGCVVLLDDSALARRAALTLATGAGVAVEVFEVIATSGGKRNRFRTAAFKAAPTGELRDAEGAELDLEDEAQTWGGGSLENQAMVVLGEFANLLGGAARTEHLGYKRKSGGRPSTPRVATLLASLQNAKSHEAKAQADGRFELKIELARGGKQTSFCSAAEHEELQKLLLGGRKA